MNLTSLVAHFNSMRVKSVWSVLLVSVHTPSERRRGSSCAPSKRAEWQQTASAAEHMRVLSGFGPHLNPHTARHTWCPRVLVFGCRGGRRGGGYIHASLWRSCDAGIERNQAWTGVSLAGPRLAAICRLRSGKLSNRSRRPQIKSFTPGTVVNVTVPLISRCFDLCGVAPRSDCVADVLLFNLLCGNVWLVYHKSRTTLIRRPTPLSILLPLQL